MFNIFKKSKTPITSFFTNDFIDIHAHLLPGIDDGAKDLDTATMLIKKMTELGIKHFVCTPHVMKGVWENSREKIEQTLAKLKIHLQQEGISDISIRTAAEYMLDTGFIELLKSKNLLCIKDNKILVEMSYINPPINLYELLFEIQIAGYIPILAHPERYNFYHTRYNEYQKLKESGCLFQLNALSLSSYYGKEVNRIALKLLKDELIDFVGTDTHHLQHLDILEKITTNKNTQLIQTITKNNARLR